MTRNASDGARELLSGHLLFDQLEAPELDRLMAFARTERYGVNEVIFHKGEQRRFVLWWDQQEKRRGTGLPSQSTDGRAAKDYGLDRDTIHRWRKRQKDPRKFDAALEKSQERCVKVCESVAVWEAVLEEEKRLAKERQKLGGRGK